VVVPGYFGTPGKYVENGVTNSYDPKDVLIDYDVYELKSQKDFENYIGKRAGIESIPGEGPTLNVINKAPNANNYTKYVRALTPGDLNGYLAPKEGEPTYELYQAIEIKDTTDDRYGKQGPLYTTLQYKEKVKEQATDDNGELLYEDEEKTIPIYKTDANGDFIYIEQAEEKTISLEFKKVVELDKIM
jgi:hypothetical protein